MPLSNQVPDGGPSQVGTRDWWPEGSTGLRATAQKRALAQAGRGFSGVVTVAPGPLPRTDRGFRLGRRGSRRARPDRLRRELFGEGDPIPEEDLAYWPEGP